MKIKNALLIVMAIFCISFGAATIASADKDNDRKLRTIGEIVKVDTAQQVIEVKDQNGKLMAFKITPDTDMEFEDNGMLSWDDDATMSDLKATQWVKVKYWGTGEIKVAKDINIYKVKSR